MLTRSFTVVHQFDKFDDPIVEDGLILGGKKGTELPMHDRIKRLCFGFDDFLASFAAVIELIIPYQVIPILLDLEVEEMEQWLCLDRLEDVLAVCICVSDFSLGGLQKESIRIGKHDVRSHPPKVGHELLEGFSRHHLNIIMQRSVV